MNRKIIKVWNVAHQRLEAEAFVVSDFSIHYDNRGVLTIAGIIDPPELVKVLYGPDTWKYVECIEDNPDEQEKQEETIEAAKEKVGKLTRGSDSSEDCGCLSGRAGEDN